VKFKTAGVANQNGDNIIDRATADVSGLSNEPAFPNNNATQPDGQGGSYIWGGVVAADQGSGGASTGGVSQYAEVAGDRDAAYSGQMPEQDYAKPTDGSTAHALGPGMSQ
jgi:hypothetical protein